MTRASTVGPKPSVWPAGERAVGCKKCAAQNKQGGAAYFISLLREVARAG